MNTSLSFPQGFLPEKNGACKRGGTLYRFILIIHHWGALGNSFLQACGGFPASPAASKKPAKQKAPQNQESPLLKPAGQALTVLPRQLKSRPRSYPGSLPQRMYPAGFPPGGPAKSKAARAHIRFLFIKLLTFPFSFSMKASALLRGGRGSHNPGSPVQAGRLRPHPQFHMASLLVFQAKAGPVNPGLAFA